MKQHYIQADRKLNPRLAHQVSTLRGSIVEQAEKNELPKGFSSTSNPNSPAMIITNEKTGKSFTCPLYAYGDVRAALKQLV